MDKISPSTINDLVREWYLEDCARLASHPLLKEDKSLETKDIPYPIVLEDSQNRVSDVVNLYKNLNPENREISLYFITNQILAELKEIKELLKNLQKPS